MLSEWRIVEKGHQKQQTQSVSGWQLFFKREERKCQLHRSSITFSLEKICGILLLQAANLLGVFQENAPQ